MVYRSTRISAGFCISLAAIILLVPFAWLVSMLIAAAFHELCHLIAIRFLSGQNKAVYLRLAGPRIDLPDLSAGKEVLCALAGPLGGLFLIFFLDVFPQLAICALLQSAYNLLPLYPLDGGRAMKHMLLVLLPPPVAKKSFRIIECICKICIVLTGIWCWVWGGLGPMVLLVGIVLVLRVK